MHSKDFLTERVRELEAVVQIPARILLHHEVDKIWISQVTRKPGKNIFEYGSVTSILQDTSQPFSPDASVCSKRQIPGSAETGELACTAFFKDMTGK